jgi:Asp-tRNA(Asn)/Glu-tRNA(Gln) amidotransferase C subunit
VTPSREEIVALAAAAGLPLPEDRVDVVAQTLGQVLALARTLDELEVDGVEPVLGPPAWG